MRPSTRSLKPEQRAILEATFDLKTTPDSFLTRRLAEECNLKPRQVQVWFQNRRQRLHKRKRRVKTTSPSAAEPPAKKAAAEPARSFYTDDFGAELPLLWLDELDVGTACDDLGSETETTINSPAPQRLDAEPHAFAFGSGEHLSTAEMLSLLELTTEPLGR
mmetsp:Transcript_14844/g.48003  ORF Transcript_14844/g.48003 Transcript_14844/m.48003 type:complete len:162 (+) Transcript_14844:90-575(+)